LHRGSILNRGLLEVDGDSQRELGAFPWRRLDLGFALYQGRALSEIEPVRITGFAFCIAGFYFGNVEANAIIF
jgi:hypothetical protein